LTYIDAVAFSERLARYAHLQGLDLDVGNGAFTVSASGRVLTESDQVQLVDWLIDQSPVRMIRMGPLTTSDEAARAEVSSLVSIDVGDMAVIGVTLLYRAGKLCPQLYLEILRRANPPVQLH
jgi:hypothetical protein